MIVCLCEGVNEREIIRVIHDGATTIPDIEERCGAGGGCRSCHLQLQEMIEKNALACSAGYAIAAPCLNLTNLKK